MSRTSGGLSAIQGASGLAANRPAAGAVPANFVYIATDTGAISQSNGVATWTALGGGGPAVPTISTFQPANPASTASAAGVMMGLGSTITFTPAVTGKLWVVLSTGIVNNTAADQAIAIPRFGTGAAPANGAANTGTVVGGVALASGGATTPPSPVAVAFKIIGLVLATPVWLDVSLSIVVGGTASMSGINCSIQEVN